MYRHRQTERNGERGTNNKGTGGGERNKHSHHFCQCLPPCVSMFSSVSFLILSHSVSHSLYCVAAFRVCHGSYGLSLFPPLAPSLSACELYACASSMFVGERSTDKENRCTGNVRHWNSGSYMRVPLPPPPTHTHTHTYKVR